MDALGMGVLLGLTVLFLALFEAFDIVFIESEPLALLDCADWMGLIATYAHTALSKVHSLPRTDDTLALHRHRRACSAA